MKKILSLSLICGLLSLGSYNTASVSSAVASSPSAVNAQFVGPEARGQASTVQQANRARPGSYVIVTGNIIDHLRDDYYTFRDATGTIRVEIPSAAWQRRTVTPDTKVRPLAEVDQNLLTGIRYLWVKTLDIVT